MDGFSKKEGSEYQLNVLGEKLESCNCSKSMEDLINLTGFYRDGFCHTSEDDYGMHTVCCVMTKEFLIYTKQVGNDLSTAIPEYNFAGLKEGDLWCLCASRWKEAYDAGKAPKIKLKSTNITTLSIIELGILKKFSV